MIVCDTCKCEIKKEELGSLHFGHAGNRGWTYDICWHCLQKIFPVIHQAMDAIRAEHQSTQAGEGSKSSFLPSDATDAKSASAPTDSLPVGSRVYLHSGGPMMTVVNSNAGYATCRWYNSVDNFMDQVFPIESLRVWPPHEG